MKREPRQKTDVYASKGWSSCRWVRHRTSITQEVTSEGRVWRRSRGDRDALTSLMRLLVLSRPKVVISQSDPYVDKLRIDWTEARGLG
jgi:hypothetical protein